MGLPLSYPMRLAITPCTHLLALRETRQISGFSEVTQTCCGVDESKEPVGLLAESKRDLRPTTGCEWIRNVMRVVGKLVVLGR